MKRKTGFKMLLVFCLMFLLAGTTASAASAKTSALRAYKKFLASNSEIYQFCLAYIDNNSVPELYVEGSEEEDFDYFSLYTYKNGKLKKIGTWWRLGVSYNVTYYAKKGVIREYCEGDAETTVTYYKLNGAKKTRVCSYTKRVNYINKKGKAVYHKPVYYNAKGKKISKSKYNKLLKKKIGSKKATKFKTYDNSKSNRNSRLK